MSCPLALLAHRLEGDSLEHLGVFPKVMNIEHLRRVVEVVFPLLLKLRIDPVCRSKVCSISMLAENAEQLEQGALPGIPQLVEMPAPVRMMIFLALRKSSRAWGTVLSLGSFCRLRRIRERAIFVKPRRLRLDVEG
jgi:hypothetical protein